MKNKCDRAFSIESKKRRKLPSKVIQLKQIEFPDCRHHSFSPPVRQDNNNYNYLLPPNHSEHSKTLILDLDETLLKSTLNEQKKYDELFKVIFI